MRAIKMVFLAIFFMFLSLSLVCAQNRSGKVVNAQGNVEVKIGKANWAPAKIGAILQESDLIRTGVNSTADVEIENAGFIEIKPNSELEFTELTTDTENNSRRTILDLSLGEILIKAKKLNDKKSKFEVKTPTSVVGVRGTAFSVKVDAVTE